MYKGYFQNFLDQEVAVNSKQQVIKEYILKEMSFSESADALDYDTPLLGDVIDSMGLQMLIPFLETEFGISIPDEELLPDNFDNINSICVLIDKLEKNSGG
jgi:acyl carrier protein